ncbi:hypothetical protein L486_03883 [Kwoniella mangroviensis CBS 10435]|uniref:Uncharacterized protein n=1 Tax=Kwoniella mangroviensis CBS 10435 TaxID=1331196 RepID=A0A1B9IQP6_9TREE|nr:hypothetical protein L486_03883 [Kwoniella mangroviensis CBS 10435]
MSFTVDITKKLGARGRAHVSSGFRFFPHPNSAFQKNEPKKVSPPPTLKSSPGTSAPATMPRTPDDPASQIPDPNIHSVALDLHQRLSVEELAASNPKIAAQAVPPRSSSLHALEKYAQSQPAGSASTPIKQEPKAVQDPVVLLRFDKYLASGNIWDFWLCHHSIYGKVVLKIVDLRDPPCINPYYDEYIDPFEIVEHALQEEELLMDELKDLQGNLVPRYYGIYLSDALPNLEIPYLAMILEYAGEPLGPGFIDLHEDWRFRRSDSVDMKNIMDVHGAVMEAAIVRTRFGFHKPGSLDMSKEVPEYAAQLDDPKKFLDSLKKPKKDGYEESERRE